MIAIDIDDASFQRLLSKMPEEVKQIGAAKEIEQAALEVIKEMTPVDKGVLQAGWVIQPFGPGEFTVLNNVAYAVIIDEGWYTDVGPKTVYTGLGPGHGVYSKQARRGVTEPFISGFADKRTRVYKTFREVVLKRLGIFGFEADREV